MKCYDKKYTFDFVINHRSFSAQRTKGCVYDVVKRKHQKIDRKAIARYMAKLEYGMDWLGSSILRNLVLIKRRFPFGNRLFLIFSQIRYLVVGVNW